ncbi:MAG: selenocysteine-specific translation elongation factor [Candidatus Eisenbacteria bacterium]
MSDPAKHIILGTAGHIDHGKTELVRALTGVDTDRLREEKERGISIELGFARLDLPDGLALGVVDVPGHERFVRTMLAGTGGVDIMVLVIAADEGVMPQTREHLDIIDLLGVNAGVIALTKTDLVGPDEIGLASEEAEELVQGTSLAGAPIIPVSSVTRDGFPELTAKLSELAASVSERSVSGPARLPIDRVFSLSGHGTIVTGTLWSGAVSAGDRLEVYPRGLEARVRSVQVHDDAVERAEAGQRTAIGLAGVDKHTLARGDTLGKPGALHVTHMFDARLRLVRSARPVQNRTRVHLHLGTAEALARIVLLETDELRPGEEELVQVRLESPVVAERDDLFVVRSYSPVTTIGGGRVLDPTPRRHKRMREDVLEALTVLEDGSPEDVLLQVVEEAGIEGLTDATLAERLGPGSLETADALLSDGRLVKLEGRLHTAEGLESLGGTIAAVLEDHSKTSPLEWGMSAEELRGKLSRTFDRKMLDALLARLAAAGALSRRGDLVRLGVEDVSLSDGQSELSGRIEEQLLDAGANVPSLDDLRAEIGGSDFDAIVKLLVETGRVVKVTSSLLFHADVVDGIRAKVVGHLDAEGELGVPAFKDMIGVTRKYAIPLFEFFDREGTTMRSRNVRVKGRKVR